MEKDKSIAVVWRVMLRSGVRKVGYFLEKRRTGSVRRTVPTRTDPDLKTRGFKKKKGCT